MKKTQIKETRKILLKKLDSIKSKLNPNTYRSYKNKIEEKRADVLLKIGLELDKIGEILKTKKGEKLTLESIKKFESKKGKLVNIFEEGTIGFFKRYRYFYQGNETLEDLYKSIIEATELFSKKEIIKPKYIGIWVLNIESNKIRGLTLQYESLVSFYKFEKKVDKLGKGPEAGSEPIDPINETVVKDYFDLSGIPPPRGQGKSDKILFNCYNIEETKRGLGDCGYNCIKFLHKKGLINCDVSNLNYLDFITIDGMKNFIETRMLNVNIVLNSFLLKNINRDDKKIFEIKGKKIVSYRLKNEDIKPVYLNYIDDSCPCIIYDEFNSHFDVIKGKLEVCGNVYVSDFSEIIKDGKLIFTAKQLNINSMIKKVYEEKFLIFDYETIINFEKSCCMSEYSLSILVLDNFQLEKLCKADLENNKNIIDEIRSENCFTFMGYDCSYKFIDWLCNNEKNIKYTFIGFNNSNFDNFILLKALLNSRVVVNQIFYNGNSLLNFKINGRHDFFDIHKHLMGSLSMNCKSFKINSCSKKSFDHNKAQMLHEKGELINFIEGNEELKEYNEHDVLATAVLFSKYREAIRNIEATNKYSKELHNIKTVGGLIYTVFLDSKKEKGYNLPKLDFKQYSDLQKYKIAGRVELFNGIQKIEERLVSTDVCSLYPYVMSIHPVYYPCGEIIETNEYMGDDVIGFYYCDIDQSNLRDNNLPKIYAKKTDDENDWGHNEVLENYLVSNVIIKLLKKYGCSVVIKNGFYFTDKRKSCDMFSFLLDFMKAKNEQDDHNKNKDIRYNPALRETLKLLMNSLSGKVIEGLHCEKTCDVNSFAEYVKIESRAKCINHINAIGRKLFISYKIDEEDICEKSQRPIYLGVLIYDYAKSYMYEMSYSKVGLNELLYTDTDASKFRYKRFIEWKRWLETYSIIVPHWEEVEKIDERYKKHLIYEDNSKVFGSFEDELSGMVGENYLFYCLQKKSWAYIVDDKSKFRFKGLNGDAIVLSLKEDIWINSHRMILNQKKAYEYSLSNKSLSVGLNVKKFFEDIFVNKYAYVLCSSFRKVVKNTLHNVGIDDEKRFNKLMNNVQVNLTVKRITVK